MATAHAPYTSSSHARAFAAAEAAARAEAQTQRRRDARRPAGWQAVEAEINGNGGRVPGRLLDTSPGGLGLVLNERLPLGTALRITPVDAIAGASAWHGREARVVYVAPLPGGSWRMGLAFTFASPSGLQIWATRAVLLAALTAAVASLVTTNGASLPASSIVGAVVTFLAAGAEWQHRSEINASEATDSSRIPPESGL